MYRNSVSPYLQDQSLQFIRDLQHQDDLGESRTGVFLWCVISASIFQKFQIYPAGHARRSLLYRFVPSDLELLILTALWFMESRSYFNWGPRAAQFYSEVIVINCCFSFECSRSWQIDAKKPHKNVSRQMYSFLELKLRQSDWKSWTKINMIFVIKTQHTVLGNRSNLNIECKEAISCVRTEYINLCPWRPNT